MTITDAYAALGLTIDASPDAVSAAFRERAKTLHPDAGGTAERFAALSEAYRRALAYSRAAPCPACGGKAKIQIGNGFVYTWIACAVCRLHPGLRW